MITTQKKYCYPQLEPVSKSELNDYFNNLANYKGEKYSFDDHNKNMDLWLKSL
jgi:hypothetical protein